MRKVYLIRHGLPDFPAGEQMCLGITDIPLGSKGFLQATAMAKLLPPVTAVFSSPLTRAVQTAEAIGLPITILDDLREMHAGEWDGLTFSQIQQQYPELYAARGLDNTLPLPGAEPEDAGCARFCRAMEQAANLSAGDFAVVAHGGVISHFLQKISGIRYKPNYTEIIPLIYNNGHFLPQEEL